MKELLHRKSRQQAMYPTVGGMQDIVETGVDPGL